MILNGKICKVNGKISCAQAVSPATFMSLECDGYNVAKTLALRKQKETAQLSLYLSIEVFALTYNWT